MKINLIVAVSENGVIGKGGDLPWHLPAELARFKKLTMGSPLIMGRKTYQSINRPLPGRKMIAVSRNPHFKAEHASVATSLPAAIAATEEAEQVFIIGGEELYRSALPIADRLYLTRVHAEVEGDARFPEFSAAEWKLVEQVQHPCDDRHAFAYTCEIYERA